MKHVSPFGSLQRMVLVIACTTWVGMAAAATAEINVNVNANTSNQPFFTASSSGLANTAGWEGTSDSGAAATTTVTRTSPLLLSGGGLPDGVSVEFDVTFDLEETSGNLLVSALNDGLGVDSGSGDTDAGQLSVNEQILFDNIVISNLTVADPLNTLAAPITLADVSAAFYVLRSANCDEAAGESATASSDASATTDVTFFDINNTLLQNDFNTGLLNTPLPAFYLTVTAGDFGLKGIGLVFTVNYTPAVSEFEFGTTIGNTINTNSTNRPFFDASTGFDNPDGWIGSIAPGAGSSTTVTRTFPIEVVGNATPRSAYLNGNGIPEGVTLSYDASFTITETNGGNLTDAGNNGLGADFAGADNQLSATEQLLFSKPVLSNIVISDPMGLLEPGASIDTDSVRWTVLRGTLGEGADGATTSSDASSTADVTGFGLAGSGVIGNNFTDGLLLPPIAPMYLTTTEGEWQLKGIGYELDFDFEPTGFSVAVWTGLGADSELGTPGNWQGNVAPTFDGSETLIFPGLLPDSSPITDLTPENNVAGRKVFGILFQDGAAAYTISGSESLEIIDNITNDSTSTAQLVNTSLTVTDTLVVDLTSDLTVKSIELQSGVLRQTGTGNLITGTLTLADGVKVTVQLDSDLTTAPIQVTSVFNGAPHTADPVVITANGDNPAAASVATLIDFTGATVTSVDLADFTLAGLPRSSVLSVSATAVEVTVGAAAQLADVLLATEGGNVEAFTISEYGTWSIATPFANNTDLLPRSDGDYALASTFGLAKDSSGNVFVSENTDFGRVVMFDSSGALIDVVGEEATLDNTNFPNLGGSPTYLAVDSNDNVFVSIQYDALGASITPSIWKIDLSGGPTAATSSEFIAASGAGYTLITPTAIEFGPDGVLYVADDGAGAIYRFDGVTGAYLNRLTDVAANTEFDFALPRGLSYDKINDQMLANIQVKDDVVAFTDLNATDLFVTDPSVLNYSSLSGGSTPTARDAEWILERVYYPANLSGGQIRTSVAGSATQSIVYSGGFTGSAGMLLVLEDRQYDLNNDGVIDATDYDLWLAAVNGPQNGVPAGVMGQDFNRMDVGQSGQGDGDVDMHDIALAQRSL